MKLTPGTLVKVKLGSGRVADGVVIGKDRYISTSMRGEVYSDAVVVGYVSRRGRDKYGMFEFDSVLVVEGKEKSA